MITYKSILVNLFKLFLSTYLFFFISIPTPFGGITLDRIVTLIIFVFIVIKFKHNYSLFSTSIFTLLCYVTFSKLFYSNELFPKYFMFFICTITFFNSYRLGKLNYDFHKYFVISFFIILIISVYSIFSFISNGIIPSEFPFLNSIPFLRAVNYDHMAEVNLSYLFPRLSLPYPTPPQLSIVLALYSFYFLDRFILKKSKFILGLLICSIIIMFTTVSRSGIIPFVFVSFIYYSIVSKSSFFKKYFKIAILISVVTSFIFLLNEDLFTIIYERFFSSSLENFTAGHSSARFLALELFSNGSIFELLFGHGIGNYPDNHAHMTVLTFLYEIGLIGLFLFLFLFIQRVIICLKFYKKYPDSSQKHLYEFMLLILTFFAMALYEFTYVIPIYIFLGLSVGASYNESKSIILK